MMDTLLQFLHGMTAAPFAQLLHLLALPPDRLVPALGLLVSFLIGCELVRIALGTAFPRSVIAQVTVCSLTFAVQALALAGVLLYADHAYPGRGWINLGFALGLYVVWYVAGQSTRLIHTDSEGADLGFMTVGALITFPAGILGALLF